jgi:hypothetical protein
MIAAGIVFGVVAVWLFCFALFKAASDGDSSHVYQIREERIMTKEAPQTFVRYPVPLDDDLQRYIVKTCFEYEISPCLVFALIGAESGYDAAAIGDNGKSFGLMQILASEHTDRCIRLGATNLLDPYQNVKVGIDFLAELMDTGNGLDWALRFYHGEQDETSDYPMTIQRNAECIMEGVQVVSE